ncbi:MAG: N-acetylneuraminate synthase family protein [Caulobacteraceae bacterium]|nr:N-acetylneuraminate synthase family protein [Caulobacteraceae bacterium]
MRWHTEVQIGGRPISLTDPGYFIADIAANHDGELGRAKDLIWRAKEAGADCAKFQHFVADKIVSQVGFERLGSQVAHQSGWTRSVVEVYDAYHTRRDWTQALVETCRAAEIDYMTTPYDLEALESQAPHVAAVKIGSGDITWHAFLDACAALSKPVLLATGASTMEDVEQAVEVVLRRNPSLVLLQCNTNYSGSEDNFNHVNLKVLQTFAIRWPGLPLGLSDHTPGHEAVLGAIALGARVIEKHFTDDNDREGPDHAFALDPATWRAMVTASRRLEAALGAGVKVIEKNEVETVVVQRRAIRLRFDRPAGHRLTEADLEVLRPCPRDALDPRSIDLALGRELGVAKLAGDVLRWTDLT